MWTISQILNLYPFIILLRWTGWKQHLHCTNSHWRGWRWVNSCGQTLWGRRLKISVCHPRTRQHVAINKKDSGSETPTLRFVDYCLTNCTMVTPLYFYVILLSYIQCKLYSWWRQWDIEQRRWKNLVTTADWVTSWVLHKRKNSFSRNSCRRKLK